MEDSHYMDKAIPMISVDDKTGKYKLTQQAHSFLKSLNGPIGVVSVAGMYRTGKSYLLNRMLLNRSNGFGVGNTVNACTKGLWCWATPIKGTSADGQSVNIIVVDTQGIGALDEDQTHDTRIFTLAILASSCFIYNSTGSIDQNALQNLSLVVNLTKHIQIKADNDHQANPDDFAHYFPSFFWVVRDFTLQLQTPQGQTISSKQYLERALAPQKGSSQDIQQKNSIRKSLSSFFRERECFTLIRPLVDENQLQNLDKMDLDSLRSDFVSQVLNFRKKVINKIKVKTINNKKINGEMYYSMLCSYVAAINEGAVPNIENAWNYMCRQQSNRLFQQSYDLFELKMKQIRIPVNQQVFMTESDKAMENAIETYKKNLIGDDIPQIWKQLNKKLKERINHYKKENQKQSKDKIAEYIKSVIHPALNEKGQKMIKNGADFNDCVVEIQNAYQSFLTKGPDVANKKLIYLQATRKIISQFAQGFIKRQNGANKRLQTVKETIEKTYQSEIQTKDKQLKDKQKNFKEQISKLDKEKIDLQSRVETLEDLLNRIKKQKQLQQQNLGKNLQSKKRQLESTKKTLQDKLQQMTKNYNEVSKKFQTKQHQWQTQQAVFKLKASQYQKKINEYQKKEKTFSIQTIAQKKQLSDKIKENSVKYQCKINELELQLKNLQEQHTQLSEKLKSEKQNYENKFNELQKKQKKSKQQLNEKSRQLQQFKTQFQLNKQKIADDFQISKNTVDKQYKQICEKSKKQEQIISQLEQKMRNLTASFEQQKAKLNQDLQFAQSKLNDAKQNLQMTKKNYQLQIQTLQTTSGQANEEIMNQRLATQRNNHSFQLQQLKSTFENEKRQLEFKVNNLKQTKDQFQLQSTLLKNQFESLKSESSCGIQNLKAQIENLNEKLVNLQKEHTTKLMEKQIAFQKILAQKQQEFQLFKDTQMSDSEKRQAKAQEDIRYLKNFFDMEKEKLQNKLSTERSKLNKKMQDTIEQYEDKLKNQREEYQQERDRLYSQCYAAQQALKSVTQKMTFDNQSLRKDLVTMERHYSQNKGVWQKKEKEYQEKISTMNQTHKIQKNKNFEKIDSLQNQINKKQKENTNLSHEVNTLNSHVQRKDAKIQQLENQFSSYKSYSQANLESLRKATKALEQELIDKKLNHEKDIALAKQNELHLSEKIAKMDEQLKRIHTDYEQKLKVVKQQLISQTKFIENKLLKDKQNLENKYQKAKKQSKQNQSNYKMKISELQKDKAVFEQKVQSMEQKIINLQSLISKSTSEYQTQMSKIKTFSQERIKKLQTQLQQTKNILVQTERQKSQHKTQKMMNKTLMENKIEHLTNTLENNKKQSSQTINKLNETIEFLKRQKANQQIHTESSYNQRVNQIQKHYRTQLNQKENFYKQQISTLSSKLVNTQNQLKNLKSNYAIESQNFKNQINSLKKKIQQTLVLSQKYQSQKKKIKDQYDLAKKQLETSFDKERIKNKDRISVLEQNLKRQEQKGHQRFFDHTKQMTKIQTQKENLIQQIEDTKERLAKIERQVNKLRNENQKLKSEKKAAKTLSYINSTKHQIINDEKKFTSPKIEDENKENNYNNTLA